MTEPEEQEFIELGDMDADAWNDYAEAQGWSDGLPLMMPTQEKVAAFVEICHGDNEPFPPMSPRRVTPTIPAIAANAVMAGCRPEYMPVVVGAVRAVLQSEYNLHGTLATTHPCGPSCARRLKLLSPTLTPAQPRTRTDTRPRVSDPKRHERPCHVIHCADAVTQIL